MNGVAINQDGEASIGRHLRRGKQIWVLFGYTKFRIIIIAISYDTVIFNISMISYYKQIKDQKSITFLNDIFSNYNFAQKL